MTSDPDLWHFILDRLRRGECIELLVVAESTGSSPGRAGYKMAVAEDGELYGSIGGGVMEVNLVERARSVLARMARSSHSNASAELIEQEHRRNSPHSSGMICSGRQTIISKLLTPRRVKDIERILEAIGAEGGEVLIITESSIGAGPQWCGARKLEQDGDARIVFERDGDRFSYREELDRCDSLFIIGGGHCALALSEVMSRLGFRISIYDDRPSLNTLEKNRFAEEIAIIDGYDEIAAYIPNGKDVFVVVMTLGYASDAIVIRQLAGHDVRYLGVLGSKAKMATLMKELKAEGLDAGLLARLHTPVGLPINSRTPEEIAISIAAQIIAVRNPD